MTRRERADNVRRRDVFTKYGPQARAVLEELLRKYQDQGVINLDDPRVLQIPSFDVMGTPPQLIKHFCARADFERAVHELLTIHFFRSSSVLTVSNCIRTRQFGPGIPHPPRNAFLRINVNTRSARDHLDLHDLVY